MGEGSIRRFFCFATMLTAAASVACGSANPPAPRAVPTFSVDVDASEVRVEHSSDAQAIRGIVTTALNEMMAERLEPSTPKPARFLASVRASTGTNGWIVLDVLLFVPTLSGIMFIAPAKRSRPT